MERPTVVQLLRAALRLDGHPDVRRLWWAILAHPKLNYSNMIGDLSETALAEAAQMSCISVRVTLREMERAGLLKVERHPPRPSRIEVCWAWMASGERVPLATDEVARKRPAREKPLPDRSDRDRGDRDRSDLDRGDRNNPIVAIGSPDRGDRNNPIVAIGSPDRGDRVEGVASIIQDPSQDLFSGSSSGSLSQDARRERGEGEGGHLERSSSGPSGHQAAGDSAPPHEPPPTRRELDEFWGKVPSRPRGVGSSIPEAAPIPGVLLETPRSLVARSMEAYFGRVGVESQEWQAATASWAGYARHAEAIIQWVDNPRLPEPSMGRRERRDHGGGRHGGTGATGAAPRRRPGDVGIIGEGIPYRPDYDTGAGREPSAEELERLNREIDEGLAAIEARRRERWGGGLG